jgi:hypothetical protein
MVAVTARTFQNKERTTPAFREELETSTSAEEIDSRLEHMFLEMHTKGS